MRPIFLVLPLACLAGCMSDGDRATPAAAAPAPAAAAPAKAPAPAAAAPAAAAPVAAAPTPAPAPKPVPTPVTVNLQGFAGPTDNAELFGYDDSNSRLFFFSSGTMTLPAKLNADGDYEIVISAACDEAIGEEAKFTVAIDGNLIGGEVSCTTTDAKEYVVKAPGLTAGEHKIAISFLNDVYKEGEYDLNFYLHGVTVRPAK
jgi:hypothetical protein